MSVNLEPPGADHFDDLPMLIPIPHVASLLGISRRRPPTDVRPAGPPDDASRRSGVRHHRARYSSCWNQHERKRVRTSIYRRVGVPLRHRARPPDRQPRAPGPNRVSRRGAKPARRCGPPSGPTNVGARCVAVAPVPRRVPRTNGTPRCPLHPAAHDLGELPRLPGRVYVIPVIGDTRLQDLTPVRLNLLYAHLLEHGRVKQAGGLAPKTVQNVHRMLHRALRDAVKWDISHGTSPKTRPPRASAARATVWTPEQLGQFVEHVRRTGSSRSGYSWSPRASTRRARRPARHDVDLQHGRVSPQRPSRRRRRTRRGVGDQD